uniref:Ankyrin repeat domain-containing protein n=1 Tax=Brugia timori TaxID=42155 RepID=A0A0R3QFQ0_9BILA
LGNETPRSCQTTKVEIEVRALESRIITTGTLDYLIKEFQVIKHYDLPRMISQEQLDVKGDYWKRHDIYYLLGLTTSDSCRQIKSIV